jgi:RHS repeat-associated protein
LTDFYYWGYNNDGQMTLLIDPKGNKTSWEYDIEGRLVKKTLQDTAVEQYAWNTKSQMFQHTSPRGLKTILGYDTQGRMNTTTYQTSTGATAFPTESVTYDVLDRVQTSTDGEGTTTYAFDTLARLGSVDGPYANDTVSYTYDALSRLDTLTTPGSVTQSFHYDSDERLDTWTDVFGSGSIAYSGRTQRVTGVSRAGGLLSTSFAYTAAGDLFKLAQIKHETGSSVISQFDYTWNARQDMQTWQRKLGSTADRETKYDLGHDAAHQLESAILKQVSNSAVISDQRWGFDSIGNRTSEHDLLSNVSAEYSHNTTNQLVNKKTYSSGQKPWVKGSLDEAGHVNLGSGPVAVKGDNSFETQSPARTTSITAKDNAGNSTTETWQLNSGSGAAPDATFTYTHDSEGNLMGDGTSTFEWDLRNRLTAIVTGTHRTEFTYDGSDRRVRVVEKESGTTQSDLRYVFHGLSLLEERASNNSTVLRRFYSGGHVDVANGGTCYAYTTDHLGSIREVMELDGTSGNPTTATLAARYDYDLWGKRTVLDGGSAAETLVMHGYTGHIRHLWSGLWLAPYRAYNSGLGRWISRDPIAEDGGINLYGYVGNGVMVAVDPLGLVKLIFFDPNHKRRDNLANGSDLTNAANTRDGIRLPMSSLQQVHDTMKKIHDSGVPIDGVEFWDHGSPNQQEMGDIGWSPTQILLDPFMGIANFIEPGGTVDFRGCSVLPSEPGEHQKYQNLADLSGMAVEAGENCQNYFFGGRAPSQGGRKRFVPGNPPNNGNDTPHAGPGIPIGKQQ